MGRGAVLDGGVTVGGRAVGLATGAIVAPTFGTMATVVAIGVKPAVVPSTPSAVAVCIVAGSTGGSDSGVVVSVGVSDGDGVSVGATVAVGSGVSVGTEVWVGVGVIVGVWVGVAVAVGVSVRVGVWVGVAVAVAVAVGVGPIATLCRCPGACKMTVRIVRP